MLSQIIARKKREIEDLPSFDINSLDLLCPAQDFKAAVNRNGSDRIRLIAEVKRASPSRGLLTVRQPKELADIYATAGADALSVLTDRHFDGESSHLTSVQDIKLPTLRKDFILAPVQVYESRRLGADALLLIAAILEYQSLLELVELTLKMGMEPVVEAHTREELKHILDTPAQVVGINNRDLKSFKVDINTSLELASLLPANRVKIGMSGIASAHDMAQLAAAGFDAALAGESLVCAADISQQVKVLLGYQEVGS